LENNQRKPVLTNGGIDLLYEYEMLEVVNATVELIKNRHDRDSILSLSQYDPPAPVCAIYNTTRRTLYCGCSSNDPNALDIGYVFGAALGYISDTYRNIQPIRLFQHHLRGNHYVTLEVEIVNDRHYIVKEINALAGQMCNGTLNEQNQIRNALQPFFPMISQVSMSGTRSINENSRSSIFSSTNQRQLDTHSCGPIAARDVVQLMNGKTSLDVHNGPKYPMGAETLRREDIENGVFDVTHPRTRAEYLLHQGQNRASGVSQHAKRQDDTMHQRKGHIFPSKMNMKKGSYLESQSEHGAIGRASSAEIESWYRPQHGESWVSVESGHRSQVQKSGFSYHRL